jgi:hypothetical protein
MGKSDLAGSHILMETDNKKAPTEAGASFTNSKMCGIQLVSFAGTSPPRVRSRNRFPVLYTVRSHMAEE